MSDRRIHTETLAGDPFHAAVLRRRRELAAMEDRYAHELMDPDERRALRDEIRALRAKLEGDGR